MFAHGLALLKNTSLFSPPLLKAEGLGVGLQINHSKNAKIYVLESRCKAEELPNFIGQWAG